MDMSDTAGPRVESASGPDRVEILVRLRHESESHQAGVDSLRKAGMKIHSVAPGPYTVVSGTASLEQLAQIEKIADVRRVEASRPLISELDLCLAEVQAQAVHRAAPPIKGSSALIGIIDSGIDYHHPDFRHADGTSRVRFYWDQRAAHNDGNVPYG